MAQDFWNIVSGQALTAQAVEEMKWEVEEIRDERPAISGTEYRTHWKDTWILKEKIDHNLQELVQGLGWEVKHIWGPFHDHYGLEWEDTWLPAEELEKAQEVLEEYHWGYCGADSDSGNSQLEEWCGFSMGSQVSSPRDSPIPTVWE
ncbi:MAG: hypothetical protein M1812_005809 [Candelaria pacifica]|nr:MAG: hypothetical protein M1812_005809 [Candelaria pacifica]